MSLIVKAPEQKFPTPPEGTFPAVCVDAIPLGKVKNIRFGTEREMVRLVWQIDEEIDAEAAEKFKMKPGSRYVIRQDYTASLDEKAKLRKHLQSWRGRAFTPVELFGFDLDTIVGAPCLLGITHNQGSKGNMVFANVEAVMKLPKGTPALTPVGYIRVKDRKVEAAVATATAIARRPPATIEEEPPAPDDYDPHGITDDDLPF